ncbi:MAG: flagellar motor switch protein FliG [Thermodesulfobacteriota bacterium]
MTNEGKLTNIEKVAVLLSTLPEEVASNVFRYLDAVEIERISICMAKMGRVEGGTVDSVINDFMQMAAEGTGSISFGKDYAEKLISKVLGENEAKSMVAKVSENKGEQSFKLLDDLDPKMLTDLTRNEHPQTIALILSHLSPEKTGKVLSNLPEELRAEVVVRISKLEPVPPEVVSEVAQMLEEGVKAMGDVGGQLGGVNSVADILNQMDRAAESSVMTKIEEVAPKLAEEIRQLMFIFEDLVSVDDRGIQEILKEISSDDLARALKTASEAVKEKIFKNMSERAVEMLNEDIEDMGPIKLSDVEKAQMSITQIALRLEEEDKITVGGRGGEEEVFV